MLTRELSLDRIQLELQASWLELCKAKNTGHLEWNLLGDFSEFETNGGSKEAL